MEIGITIPKDDVHIVGCKLGMCFSSIEHRDVMTIIQCLFYDCSTEKMSSAYDENMHCNNDLSISK
jgi:hypothetical protein